MSGTLVIAISFIAFLLLFTGVGVYSASRKQNTTTDYLLASRGVNPWLTGLSAFATAHSGGTFIGFIGVTYTFGVSSAWLHVGWFLGNCLAWSIVHKPLRVVSEETGSETIGSFLAGGDRQNRAIAIVSALITIAFLSTYASSQLLAGSKALHVIFGWDYNIGIILGTAIVVAYCFSGGIRASIWTDALQSVLMVISMVAMLAVTLIACGGFSGLWQQLAAIDPALVAPIPQNLQYGFGLYLLSWLAAGVGVAGQPHIMVRAMALDRAENMARTRNIYIVSAIVFSTAAILVGLCARVLLPGLMENGDPELALPQIALAMMPAIGVGVILAGTFSAVVSTADSQILACSAALTQDLFPKMSHSYKIAKVGTLLIATIVLVIALAAPKNAFALIVFAWSALAVGLGPLLMLRAWRFPVSSIVGIAMMVAGIATAIVWNVVFQLSRSIYEVLPGMLAGFLVYGIARLLYPRLNRSSTED